MTAHHPTYLSEVFFRAGRAPITAAGGVRFSRREARATNRPPFTDRSVQWGFVGAARVSCDSRRSPARHRPDTRARWGRNPAPPTQPVMGSTSPTPPTPGPSTPRQARRCTDPREPTDPGDFSIARAICFRSHPCFNHLFLVDSVSSAFSGMRRIAACEQLECVCS